MARNLSEEINRLESNSEFKSILFDVNEIGLKLSTEVAGLQFDLKDDQIIKINNKPAKGYKALVNLENFELLTVVSKDYELILNSDAIENGQRLFNQLLGVNEDRLRPFKVVTSKRKTFCHVDFVDIDYNPMKFKQDKWLPFLRVTNSYNKMFKLRYQIGFVRSLCSNGMIFDEESITYSRNHMRGELKVKEAVNRVRFNSVLRDFQNNMEGLFKYSIPIKYMDKVVNKVIDLNFALDHKNPSIQERAYYDKQKYDNKVKELINEYANELGETAYSTLNVLTDLSSHPSYDVIPKYSSRINGIDKRITEWARNFPTTIMKPDFSWKNYLNK